MNTPSLVWVTVFSCPGLDNIVRPFYESKETEQPPSTSELCAVIQASFEAAQLPIQSISVSDSGAWANIVIPVKNKEHTLVITIKTHPVLKVGTCLFKLEEFES